MNIFVTANEWSPNRDDSLKRILTPALTKYGDSLAILVGYTAPSIRIAMIAMDMGIGTQIIAPDLEKIKGSHINTTNSIVVTSKGQLDYLKYIATSSDSAIAFDKRDPIIFHLKKCGKKVWLPLHNEML